MPMTLAMIVTVNLLLRSLRIVCFHTSILVTKLAFPKILPAVFSCRCLLLGTFYTASSEQHTRQVVQCCLVYESNK